MFITPQYEYFQIIKTHSHFCTVFFSLTLNSHPHGHDQMTWLKSRLGCTSPQVVVMRPHTRGTHDQHARFFSGGASVAHTLYKLRVVCPSRRRTVATDTRRGWFGCAEAESNRLCFFLHFCSNRSPIICGELKYFLCLKNCVESVLFLFNFL